VNILVIYDSTYGNTEKVAKAIGNAVGGDAKVLRVGDVKVPELKAYNLLFIGCPTQWNKPTKPMQEFLNKIPESALKGIKTAVFDTRLTGKLTGLLGYADKKIAGALTKKGAVVLNTEGFFVKGSALQENELARAVAWAKEIASR